MLSVLTQTTINHHLIRTTLKGVTQITVMLVFDGLIDVLILYVLPNLGSVQANGAYIISTVLAITLNSWRSFPYMILRRFFWYQTMWYLHSQTVCDRLFFYIKPLAFG